MGLRVHVAHGVGTPLPDARQQTGSGPVREPHLTPEERFTMGLQFGVRDLKRLFCGVYVYGERTDFAHET